MRFTSVFIVTRPPECDWKDKPILLVRSAIERRLESRSIPVINTPDKITKHTLVIAIGGDGTMLEAMRIVAQYGGTAMGINMGRVGFLTDFLPGTTEFMKPDTIADVLQLGEVLDGNFPIEERTLVAVSVGCDMAKGKSTFSSLGIAGNEVSISRQYSDSMIEYRLTFDDVDAGIHRANSLIVATATGSTAYALSAGGTLMYPTAQGLQVVPVAPLTLTSRPIIVSETTKIKIQAWGLGMAVRLDGTARLTAPTSVIYTQEAPLTIVVEAYSRKARMLHSKQYNFFHMLSQKLGWISG